VLLGLCSYLQLQSNLTTYNQIQIRFQSLKEFTQEKRIPEDEVEFRAAISECLERYWVAEERLVKLRGGKRYDA